MNKIITGVAVIVAVLLLAACGSSPKTAAGSSTPTPKASSQATAGQLTVDKTGWATDLYPITGGQTAQGELAMFITNHSKTQAAVDTVVQATLYSASGMVLEETDTSVDPIPVIRSGETFGFAMALSTLQSTDAIVKADVSAQATTWVRDRHPGWLIRGGDVYGTQQDNGIDENLTGQITSTYPIPLSNVAVYMVCTDPSGNVVGGLGGWTGETVALLAANGTSGFQGGGYIQTGSDGQPLVQKGGCKVYGQPPNVPQIFLG